MADFGTGEEENTITWESIAASSKLNWSDEVESETTKQKVKAPKKVEPPKVEPPKKVEQPKVEPPKKVEQPKVEPPKKAEHVKKVEQPKKFEHVKRPEFNRPVPRQMAILKNEGVELQVGSIKIKLTPEMSFVGFEGADSVVDVLVDNKLRVQTVQSSDGSAPLRTQLYLTFSKSYAEITNCVILMSGNGMVYRFLRGQDARVVIPNGTFKNVVAATQAPISTSQSSKSTSKPVSKVAPSGKNAYVEQCLTKAYIKEEEGKRKGTVKYIIYFDGDEYEEVKETLALVVSPKYDPNTSAGMYLAHNFQDLVAEQYKKNREELENCRKKITAILNKNEWYYEESYNKKGDVVMKLFMNGGDDDNDVKQYGTRAYFLMTGRVIENAIQPGYVLSLIGMLPANK
jgi:hypothetical protein